LRSRHGLVVVRHAARDGPRRVDPDHVRQVQGGNADQDIRQPAARPADHDRVVPESGPFVPPCDAGGRRRGRAADGERVRTGALRDAARAADGSGARRHGGARRLEEPHVRHHRGDDPAPDRRLARRPLRHGRGDCPAASAVHAQGAWPDGDGPDVRLRPDRASVLHRAGGHRDQPVVHVAALPLRHRAHARVRGCGDEDARQRDPEEDGLVQGLIAMLILLLAASVLAFAVYFAADAATAPAREQELAVRRATRYGITRLRGAAAPRLRFRERVVTPGIQPLAAMTLRVNPKATADAIGTKLLAAGLSTRITATQFLALKAGLALASVLFMVAFAIATAPVAGILLAPFAAGFGFLCPDVFLTFKTRARREAVRAQLPDALDLLAVSVEAGLGFDGAVTKLTEHMEGPLV